MFGTLLSCNGTGVHEPPGVGLVRWSDSQHMAITKALLGCYVGIWYTCSDKVSRFFKPREPMTWYKGEQLTDFDCPCNSRALTYVDLYLIY